MKWVGATKQASFKQGMQFLSCLCLEQAVLLDRKPLKWF